MVHPQLYKKASSHDLAPDVKRYYCIKRIGRSTSDKNYLWMELIPSDTNIKNSAAPLRSQILMTSGIIVKCESQPTFFVCLEANV